MALEQELTEIASEVWSTFLGGTLGPAPGKPVVEVTAFVQITGAYEGTITIACSDSVARHAAGAMFGLEAADVADSELADAMGELANVLGGRVKPLLDGSAKLSLPAVVRGHDFAVTVPGSTVVTEVSFGWDDESVRIEVLKRDS